MESAFSLCTSNYSRTIFQTLQLGSACIFCFFLFLGCSPSTTDDPEVLKSDKPEVVLKDITGINPEEVVLEEVFIEEVANDFDDVIFHKKSDLNIKEDGFHFIRGGRTLYSGGVHSFHDSKKLALRYIVEDGLKNGPYEKYFTNGKLNRRCSFKKGELHGSFAKFYTSGQRASEGQYLHNMEVGVFTWWYENGFRSEQGGFNRGKEHGVWMYYSEIGTVLDKITFFEGEELVVEDGY